MIQSLGSRQGLTSSTIHQRDDTNWIKTPDSFTTPYIYWFRPSFWCGPQEYSLVVQPAQNPQPTDSVIYILTFAPFVFLRFFKLTMSRLVFWQIENTKGINQHNTWKIWLCRRNLFPFGSVHRHFPLTCVSRFRSKLQSVCFLFLSTFLLANATMIFLKAKLQVTTGWRC